MNSDDDSVSWRGVPITEIYGSQSPWGAPEFPLIVPAHNHAVLYHIPNKGRTTDDVPPKPRTGTDVWNHDYVRMPCSTQSLYPVEDSNGETHLKKRWEIIETALSKPIRNSEELANVILSYNTKFKTVWKFRALHKLFDHYLEEEESQYFFDVTLPEIVKLTLALPRLVQAPIPLLKQHKNRSVSLSQQQIASLLANAFFCTFPRRNTTKKTSEYSSYPFINFNRLFNASPSDSVLEKLKCICHYFRRVCTKVPAGVVTYSRRSVAPDSFPKWHASERHISALPLHVDSKTTIEDAQGLIQVDFANKFLGGGVLNFGCVQEEIRFVICPELMLSMLFTEMLKPNEALMIIGCERYSLYSGYGGSFHWCGDFRDDTPFDSSGRRRCAVLAIDALPYANIKHEHSREMITRELNKAWIGVSYATDEQSDSLQYPGVATGNWGCGAFGGTPRLKSLVQIMACAQARRPMAYFTFSDVELRDDIINVYNLLARHNVTVGQLYKYIIRFTATDVRLNQLPSFLQQVLLDDRPKTPNAKPLSPKVSMTSPDATNKMDTSDIEIVEQNLSGSVLKEFLNDSPDLFSQSEYDQSICEVKINMPEPMDDGADGELNKNEESIVSENKRTVGASRLVDEMQKIDDENTKQNLSLSNTTPSKRNADPKANQSAINVRTSRLFDEMQKFDEENGKLNLSLPNTSPLKRNADSKLNQSVSIISSEDKIKLDASSEAKKKMGKKITDYFSKKSI
ncbi:hypothetical protein ABMA27_001835 [Loxostege sticticalis]|uniref:poly(ADP-ribose) glycohydrolase n=1 Tax=Loxostege sticticalis TaxID=481309 RepID=A0ABR3HVN2_LOXSC